MSEPRQNLDRAVAIRVLRLEALAQGIGYGLVFGLGVFVATNWLVVKGGTTVGPHLKLLSQYFIGYKVTFVGSLIGFAYGFACGFVAGYLVSTIYNRVAARGLAARPRHGTQA